MVQTMENWQRYRRYEISVAERYGIETAVILEEIRSRADCGGDTYTALHDGCRWVRTSQKAFAAMFPEMKPRAVRAALEKLETAGLVLVENHNESALDRTKWYAPSEKGSASACGGARRN